MINIAINGFGRIGRLLLRAIFDNKVSFLEKNEKDFNIVAINDLGDCENLLYLLKYDTVYGKFSENIRKLTKNKKLENGKEQKQNYLKINNKEILFLQEKDPTNLPWRELGIDVVIESTGAFESYEKAKVHVKAGAKRVVITAPAKDSDGAKERTVLVGVNEDELREAVLSSNGSCTTNAASPVIQIMNEKIGVEKAILNTVHGYTATQGLVDSPDKGNDFRRGRAAAQNIIPSTTGAAIAVTRAIKELEGKFDGMAMRVPVLAGSVADITFLAKRKTTESEINDIFREAAKERRWSGILRATEDPIVSSDILGESCGAIIDLSFTKVVDGDLVKVLSWYDNEFGYVATLIRHLEKIASLIS